jgi:hypothetical protein
VFNATSTGELTLVEGSPFSVSGQMEGINGKYLISVGTTHLHTYSIASNGAVGRMVSQVNVADHTGGECGQTSGYPAVLDHTGKYFYVTIVHPDIQIHTANCAAIQSYRIRSNGEFEFLGAAFEASYSGGYAEPGTLNTVSSNDQFVYGVMNTPVPGPGILYGVVYEPFTIYSNGLLVPQNDFSSTGPTLDAGFTAFFPGLVAADNAGHLAVLGSICGTVCEEGAAFASFTIQPNGALVSTNLQHDLPGEPSESGVNVMNASYDGSYLAVGAGDDIYLYNFNGAAPLTFIAGAIGGGQNIMAVGWDKNDNVYGLNYESGSLFVYHVMGPTITAAPGSPHAVAGAYGVKGLIVVPK